MDEQEVRAAIDEINSRCDHIERYLHKQFGSTYSMWSGTESDGLPEEIADLVRAGKESEAIKRYRHLSGLSLSDAMKAIKAASRD